MRKMTYIELSYEVISKFVHPEDIPEEKLKDIIHRSFSTFRTPEVCIHIYIYEYTYMYKCTFLHMFIYIYTHMNTYIYTYEYMDIYTYEMLMLS
jgi:hypothetical protein